MYNTVDNKIIHMYRQDNPTEHNICAISKLLHYIASITIYLRIATYR